MFKKFAALLATVVTIMSIGLAAPAAAVEPNDWEESSVVDAADYRALIADLKSSGAVVQGGIVTVQVPGYGEMSFADPDYSAPITKGGYNPSVGGGWDGWKGPYVTFSRIEQGMIINGGAATLGVAICGIPAVGQAACAGAAAIIAAGAYYLTEKGRCPTSFPKLKVYVATRAASCVR